MESKVYFFLGLAMVVLVIRILKYLIITSNQVVGDYSSNDKVIPWKYSEHQGTWVLPEEPFSPSEMNGNIYTGKDDVDTTWENFNKKDDCLI